MTDLNKLGFSKFTGKDLGPNAQINFISAEGGSIGAIYDEVGDMPLLVFNVYGNGARISHNITLEGPAVLAVFDNWGETVDRLTFGLSANISRAMYYPELAKQLNGVSK